MVKCGVCQEDFPTTDERQTHMSDKHADFMAQFEKPTDLIGRIEGMLSQPTTISTKHTYHYPWNTAFDVTKLNAQEASNVRAHLMRYKNTIQLQIIADIDKRIAQIDAQYPLNAMTKRPE